MLNLVKGTMKTPEDVIDVVLVSLLLFLNKFSTFKWCLQCWLRTSKCLLGKLKWILNMWSQGFVTGGQDGVVVIWDESFTQPLRAFKIETSRFPTGTILLHDCPPVRSIHTDEGNVLVGTGNNEIIQIHYDGSMELFIQVGMQRPTQNHVKQLRWNVLRR